jgi:tetratricopeptide (TPR) repeat protein
MKTSFLNIYNIFSVTAISILFLIAGLFQFQNAYGAGSPKVSTPSPQERRQKANIHFDKGESFRKEGNYKEASKAFKKAVRADSTYAEAYSNLGYTLRKQNLYGKAIKAYRKAIKLKPKLAQAHEYLGEAYAEMSEFEKAEKELNTLRQLDSDEAGKLEKFIADTKAGKKTDSKW